MRRTHGSECRDGAIDVARIDVRQAVVERGPHAEQASEVNRADHGCCAGHGAEHGPAQPREAMQPQRGRKKQRQRQVGDDVRVMQQRSLRATVRNQPGHDDLGRRRHVVQAEIEELRQAAQVHGEDQHQQHRQQQGQRGGSEGAQADG